MTGLPPAAPATSNGGPAGRMLPGRGAVARLASPTSKLSGLRRAHHASAWHPRTHLHSHPHLQHSHSHPHACTRTLLHTHRVRWASASPASDPHSSRRSDSSALAPRLVVAHVAARGQRLGVLSPSCACCMPWRAGVLRRGRRGVRISVRDSSGKPPASHRQATSKLPASHRQATGKPPTRHKPPVSLLPPSLAMATKALAASGGPPASHTHSCPIRLALEVGALAVGAPLTLQPRC